MSHFALSIITDNPSIENIIELLAPFNEDKGDVCYGDTTCGTCSNCENEESAKNNTFGWKWDWYEIGGRWNNMITLKDGREVNIAQIKDIFFYHEYLKEQEKLKSASEVIISDDIIDQFRNESNPPVLTMSSKETQMKNLVEEKIKKARKHYNENLEKYKDNKKLFNILFGNETEESFVQKQLDFQTFAVLTPDGVWHEKGEMGWFGISSDTQEESDNWDNSFYDSFIKNANPEHYIVVVDCHI